MARSRTNAGFGCPESAIQDRGGSIAACTRNGSHQEWIGFALDAKLSGRAMAADERHIVAERKQFGFNGVDERGMIAVREIRAPDRPAEDHISHKRESLPAIEKNDRSGECPGQ